MSCCCMKNCNNSYRHGNRMFRFPADSTRRDIWLKNCKKEFWEYKPNLRLCEAHFEASQFESKRQDNVIKLKPNAIPTLFDLNFTKPQKSIKIKNIYLSKKSKLKKTVSKKKNETKHFSSSVHKQMVFKKIKPDKLPVALTAEESQRIVCESVCNPSSINNDSANQESPDKETEKSSMTHSQLPASSFDSDKMGSIQSYIKPLVNENKEKEELGKNYKLMSSFLTDCQMKALRFTWLNWDKDTLIKCMKLRLALGKHGYEYLRKTGYPAPSCSTLNRQIKGLDVDLGVECVHYESDGET